MVQCCHPKAFLYKYTKNLGLVEYKKIGFMERLDQSSLNTNPGLYGGKQVFYQRASQLIADYSEPLHGCPSAGGFFTHFHKQISNPDKLLLSVRGTTFSL